jgi:hypothetical protein
MSDQQAPTPPGPRPASIALSILLFVIGVVLLLPGLCALFFMGVGGSTEPIFVLLWAICFAIAAGGIALMAYAIRRQRRR